MTAFSPFRLLACTAISALGLLLFAGSAAADDAGESAPMPVPEALAAPPEKTLDDKVGDVLDDMGGSLAKVGAGAVDILILRPMGSVATAVGFGFFAVSSPLWGLAVWSIPDGFSESWEIFVMAPVEYTFVRPLGQF